MICEGGRSTEFRRPPHIIPWGGVVSNNKGFHLVCVEFKAVVLHPKHDVHHASVKAGFGGGGVFG